MNPTQKEALKALRQTRKETIRRTTARMKEQKKTVKAIKTQLSNGSGTVPEIAQATQIPSADVLWYLAALKKYGEIAEGDKEGSYFRYHLVQNEREPIGDEHNPVSSSPEADRMTED